MKQAITYRRASTNQTKQVNSLDNQAQLLWRFAEDNDYEVIEDVVEYASAAKGEREGFNYAVSLLSKNPDLYLIVNDLTRLSRDIGNWNDWAPFLGRIRFARKGDVALTELEASLLLVIAANESRELGNRIREGIQRSKERAAEAGRPWNYGTPSNLQFANKAKAASTKEWRTKIVAVCQMLDNAGISTLRDKCEWLDENGYISQRGNKIGLATLQRALKAA